MKAFDLDELGRVIERHPELRTLSPVDTRKNYDVVVNAILQERHLPPNDRRLTEWLAAYGFDVQRTLNRMLCGHKRISADKVRYLLDRGADPEWVAPNGRSVLEHALVTYWNAEAVDALAVRARHPSALWIAAGLGDVDGVARFLDRDGNPTEAAYRTREIGIRAALGASTGHIVRGIFSRAFIQISIGLLVGSGLVALVGLGSMRQLVLLLAADGVMLVVGLTACALPLRRALRIDPTEALRAEG